MLNSSVFLQMNAFCVNSVNENVCILFPGLRLISVLDFEDLSVRHLSLTSSHSLFPFINPSFHPTQFSFLLSVDVFQKILSPSLLFLLTRKAPNKVHCRGNVTPTYLFQTSIWVLERNPPPPLLSCIQFIPVCTLLPKKN